MKLQEFKKLFPNADMSMFKVADGNVVYGKYNDDVEEPAFWDNQIAIFDLHLPYNDQVSYYQHKNKYLEKVRRSIKLEKSREKKVWQPIEWGYNPSNIPDNIVRKPRKIDLENFRIYVNEKDFFMLNDTFPDFGNVTKIDLKDPKNIYGVSIKAIYVLSYLGGVSLKNLESAR